MKREERLALFIDVVISIVKLERIRDIFFSKRLHNFLSKILTKTLASWQASGDNVAQYITHQDLLNDIRELNSFLEELSYLHLIRPTSLLIARRALMHWYVFELQSKPKLSPLKKEDKQVSLTPEAEPHLSENQMKILNFIKKFERVRARDVIDEFSALSQRTVKRNLKDLMHNGFIKKREEDRAVYYMLLK